MENLEKLVLSCTKCELYRSRNKVVFGGGNFKSRIMFIGEAPGSNEDLTGLPFVGRAGKLLDKALHLAVLSRQDMFITNILKCRPPNNRNPNRKEIEACSTWLNYQIDLINPILIVLAGGVATKTLLKTDKGISKLRGRIFGALGRLVIPIYHPAYILRNISKESIFFDDIKLISNLIKEIKNANLFTVF